MIIFNGGMNSHDDFPVSKWPFLAGDLFLLLFAGAIVYYSEWPLDHWLILASGLAVLAGAILLIIPYVLEYRAIAKTIEANIVTSTLQQLQQLETVANHIGQATSQWQMVHEVAEKTTQTIHDISDRMTTEAKAFTEFMQKANEAEKSHLRLEVEKLRRAEGDWLQVLVAILDHVFALHQAGVRSGQPSLMEQLDRFQGACRDVIRRIGLVPFTAVTDETYDPSLHQPADPEQKAPSKARIKETIATGFTFQGHLIRRALVTFLESTSIPTPPLQTADTASENLASTPSPPPESSPSDPSPADNSNSQNSGTPQREPELF